MCRYLDTSTKWPKSWSSMEDLVVPLERNLYGHPLAGLLLERQFEKILFKARLGKGFQLGMPVRTPSKRVVLVCVCGRHQNWLGRNKTLTQCGKYL